MCCTHITCIYIYNCAQIFSFLLNYASQCSITLFVRCQCLVSSPVSQIVCLFACFTSLIGKTLSIGCFICNFFTIWDLKIWFELLKKSSDSRRSTEFFSTLLSPKSFWLTYWTSYSEFWKTNLSGTSYEKQILINSHSDHDSNSMNKIVYSEFCKTNFVGYQPSTS